MKISTIAAYVDQPIILGKLHKKMPAALVGAGTIFGVRDCAKHGKNKLPEKRKECFIKNTVVIASTIGATLLGTRYLKIKGKNLLECEPLKEILKKQTRAINEFMEKNPLSGDLAGILNKAKEKQLSPKQIETLSAKLPAGNDKTKLFVTILPKAKDLNSKEVFEKILQLSVLGAIPIVGGVAGGIAADKITHTSSRRGTANKVKEGLYQYFANIFLCNVGAGAFLFASEKLVQAKKIKPLTPAKKLGVILAGITATGIAGGSYIANLIAHKAINPMFDKNRTKNKRIYDERRPEALDIALHADDIATAGVLAGLKWIEPALPFMYFISGYRAGTGYRNPEKQH
ncbi:MAG: hypothetical protein LBK53_04105 [Heliobacteriaceae bacterium]|jgi:hypothetical protein|nr:hypothetical protein [Heliobacteriaceae bacterium]